MGVVWARVIADVEATIAAKAGPNRLSGIVGGCYVMALHK